MDKLTELNVNEFENKVSAIRKELIEKITNDVKRKGCYEISEYRDKDVNAELSPMICDDSYFPSYELVESIVWNENKVYIYTQYSEVVLDSCNMSDVLTLAQSIGIMNDLDN